MGGSFRLESAPGQGSAFSFDLHLPAVDAGELRARDLEGQSIGVAAEHPRDVAALSLWISERGGKPVLLAEPEALLLPEHAEVKRAIVDGRGLPDPSALLAARRDLSLVLFELPNKIAPGASGARVVRAASPLRRTQIEAQLRALWAQSGAADTKLARRFVGTRVLVADDNAVNRAVVEAMLGRLGCTPLLAQGGAEALSTLKQQRFDLVLMDCEMPDLDGISVTRLVRAEERAHQQQEQTIVALTAHALDAYRVRCLEAGMNDVLTKPLSLAALEGCLERFSPAA